MKANRQNISDKRIKIQGEEVIVNMRMDKFIYEAWEKTAKDVGVNMIQLLEVFIMYSPRHEFMKRNWPWYAGKPWEQPYEYRGP